MDNVFCFCCYVYCHLPLRAVGERACVTVCMLRQIEINKFKFIIMYGICIYELLLQSRALTLLLRQDRFGECPKQKTEQKVSCSKNTICIEETYVG